MVGSDKFHSRDSTAESGGAVLYPPRPLESLCSPLTGPPLTPWGLSLGVWMPPRENHSQMRMRADELGALAPLLRCPCPLILQQP